MSVIVAKSSTPAPSTGQPTPVSGCFPAITVERAINPGELVVIDGVSTGGFRAAMWLVCIIGPSGNLTQSYQILGTHRNGSLPTYGQRSLLGDDIQHTVNVTVTAGVLQLTVRNDESASIVVIATRLAVPLSNREVNVLDVTEIGTNRALVRSGLTSTIDFIPLNQAAGALWAVTLTTPTGDRVGSQVFAQLIGNVAANQYALVGSDTHPHNIVITEVVGVGVELAIQNLSSVDYYTTVTRIPIQTTASPPYCGNTSGLALWVPSATTVNVGATAVVESIPVTSSTGAKWLFCAFNQTSLQTLAAEITVSLTPSSPTYVIHGVIGDTLNISVNTTVVGGQLTLYVTNNEANPVTVNLLRVPTM